MNMRKTQKETNNSNIISHNNNSKGNTKIFTQTTSNSNNDGEETDGMRTLPDSVPSLQQEHA